MTSLATGKSVPAQVLFHEGRTTTRNAEAVVAPTVDVYLNRLIARMNNGMVKVVTGIRRCGKTYPLFRLFKDHLLESGIDSDHIIEVALDDEESSALRDPQALSAHLRSKIENSREQYYVLLDEVQFAISTDELKDPDTPPRLYGVLNGMLRLDNVDVYVTGSNSKLFSSDVMPKFRGHGDEIRVRPLSCLHVAPHGLSASQGEKWNLAFKHITPNEERLTPFMPQVK